MGRKTNARAAVLKALSGGPVRGMGPLIEKAIDGRAATVDTHVILARAVRAEIAEGSIKTVKDGSSVVLSLSEKAAKRGKAATNTGGFALGAVAAAAMITAGCMSMPAATAPMVVVEVSVLPSVQQVSDGAGGMAFATCVTTCTQPTVKTSVVGIGSTDADQSVQGRRLVRVPAADLVAAIPKAPRWSAVVAPSPTPTPAALHDVKELRPGAKGSRTVYFGHGRSSVGRDSRQALTSWVHDVGKSAQTVTVRGTADSTGDVTLNNVLALQRASRVRDELVALGIEASRIRVTSCGSCYVAPNDTEAGRAANRSATVEVGQAVAIR